MIDCLATNGGGGIVSTPLGPMGERSAPSAYAPATDLLPDFVLNFTGSIP